MINKITIHSLEDALKISYKESCLGYNSWISVVDDEDQRKINRLKNNFYVQNKNFEFFSQLFYDWSDEHTEPYIIKNLEEMGPKKTQIQNIICFVNEKLIQSPIVYNLGINCFAGISRSTAIGIVCWVLTGKTPNDSLNEILKIRPQATPNLRILRFASDILNIDIYNPIKTWLVENKTKIFYEEC